jgi:hypothetical protein
MKIQKIQFWQAWRPCSPTYPLVKIGVIENISHTTAKMCTMHSFGCNSQIKCVQTRVGMWKLRPQFVCPFQFFFYNSSATQGGSWLAQQFPSIALSFVRMSSNSWSSWFEGRVEHLHIFS